MVKGFLHVYLSYIKIKMLIEKIDASEATINWVVRLVFY